MYAHSVSSTRVGLSSSIDGKVAVATGRAHGIETPAAKVLVALGAKVASLDVNSSGKQQPGIVEPKTDVTNSAADEI